MNAEDSAIYAKHTERIDALIREADAENLRRGGTLNIRNLDFLGAVADCSRERWPELTFEECYRFGRVVQRKMLARQTTQ